MKKIFPTIAVNGIIFGEDNTVLLTRRMDTGQWVLPGGMVETGETLENAIKREVFEEINVVSTVCGCTGIYSIANQKIIPPAKMHLVVIAMKLVIQNGTPSVSSEVSEVRYFPLNKLPNNIVYTHVERIQDATNTTLLEVK